MVEASRRDATRQRPGDGPATSRRIGGALDIEAHALAAAEW
jgi:hypothetical protein